MENNHKIIVLIFRTVNSINHLDQADDDLIDILSMSAQGCSSQGKVQIAVGKHSATESPLKL